MKITMAIAMDADAGLGVVSAYSEDDFDYWGEVPGYYVDKTRRCNDEMREVCIEVPRELLKAAFTVPAFNATVVVEG